MPRIDDSPLHYLLQQLAADGKLDSADVERLIDEAQGDACLSAVERAVLQSALAEHGDKIEDATARKRLEGFLQMSDATVRHRAWELERADGVIHAADARALADLVDGDGPEAGSRAFSLAALQIGARLTKRAREILSAKADAVGPAPIAFTLGDFGGASVVVGADGRLGRAGLPAGREDTITTIASLAAALSAGESPLIAITDRKLLRRIAAFLGRELKGFLPRQDMPKSERLLGREVRAGLYKLLEEAAVRAGELGDEKGQKKILDTLLAACAREPFRALRDFTFQSFVLRAENKELPARPEASEAIFPSRPPYDKWLADGKIKIHYVCDDDGSPTIETVDFFRDIGFRKKTNRDGSFDMAFPRRGPTVIEVHIAPPPPQDEEPQLFDRMGDEDVDVIVYSGHAGYGQRVDRALAQGAGGTGKDKLIVLLQCWGAGNVETLESAFPDAQLLSTTDSTDDNIDHTMLARLFDGFLQQEGWTEIHRGIAEALESALGGSPDYPNKDWPRHFFAPNTLTELIKHYDRDQDGNTDYVDGIFNVQYPNRAGVAGGYDPVTQPVPVHRLSGEALSESIDALSLVLRYDEMLPSTVAKRLGWGPELLTPVGYFVPHENDHRAFELTARGDRIEVALSARFAHTNIEDLSRMLAIELGTFLGRRAGLEPEKQTALGLAMLDRVLHQQANWYADDGPLDSREVEELLLCKRYNLGKLTFDGLSKAIALGDDDHFTPRAFAALARFVEGEAELAQAASKPPQRVGTSLEVPERLFITGPNPDYVELTAENIEPVLSRIGVTGRLVGAHPDWVSSDASSSILAIVAKPDNGFEIISMALSEGGLVDAAARLDLDFASTLVPAVEEIINELVACLRIDKDMLLAVFRQSRPSGGDVLAALGEVFKAARRQMPMGEPSVYLSPDLPWISQTIFNDAWQRLGRQMFECSEVETAALAWLETTPGLDQVALSKVYVEGLIQDGLVRGLRDLMAALPNPLPPCPYLLLEACGTPRPRRDGSSDEVADLYALYKEKTQTTDYDLLEAWVPGTSWHDYRAPDAVATAIHTARDQRESAAQAVERVLDALRGLFGDQLSTVFIMKTDLLVTLGLITEGEAQALNHKLANG